MSDDDIEVLLYKGSTDNIEQDILQWMADENPKRLPFVIYYENDGSRQNPTPSGWLLFRPYVGKRDENDWFREVLTTEEGSPRNPNQALEAARRVLEAHYEQYPDERP